MRKVFLIWFVLPCIALAQSPTDSTSVLPFDEFYQLVIAHHPIVKQAELLSEVGKQQLRTARGSFDPKITGKWSRKDFDGTQYYNKVDASLKVPTWFPVDPEIGMQQNSGTYLSSENFISESTDNRQVYLGASIPIGKGLFIDQRRAVVRQASLMRDMIEADRISEINKILLKASKDYWQWLYAYNEYVLQQRSIAIAQEVFDRTKLDFQYGETSVVDTIQAKITLQQRINDFTQANILRMEAALLLSNHLWTADGMPLELQDGVVPESPIVQTLAEAELQRLQDLAELNHPDLQKIRLKGEVLDVERKLAQENLKPQVDLNYHLLDQPLNTQGDFGGIALDDNRRIGVEFGIPIFLRKERGKLGETKAKLQQNTHQQVFQQQQIRNSINAQFFALQNTQQMLTQQRAMVNNYELLLQAEQLNLANGESDLFKLNIQIEKLIQSQSKFYKLQSDYQKKLAELYWLAGTRVEVN